MRPWLVTGAGGFIGARVCRRLCTLGDRWVGLLRPGESPPPTPPGAPWPEGSFRVVDLRDSAAAADCVASIQPRAIINLAAVGVAPTASTALPDFVLVNVLVPGVLLRALSEDAVLVQVGSMSQYAARGEALSEDRTPRADATLYAWSKNAAETLLVTLAAQMNRALIRARLFGVVGPGESPHRLLPSIVAGWHAARPVSLSDGRQVRDVLHVDDVATALVHVARSPSLVGKPVNVARGEGRTVRSMAERAARRLGCEQLLRFGDLPRRPDEAEHLVADVSRLRSSGFSPALSFDESIDFATDQIAASDGHERGERVR
jgi:UDP-glucose 4-epimerase